MKVKNKLVGLFLAVFMVFAGILSPSKSYAQPQDLEEYRKDYTEKVKNMTADEVEEEYEKVRSFWNYFYGYYGTGEQRKPFIQMQIKRMEDAYSNEEDYYPEIYQEYKEKYDKAKAHALEVYNDPNASGLEVNLAILGLKESYSNLYTKEETDSERERYIAIIKEMDGYPNAELEQRIETIRNTNSYYEQYMAYYGSNNEEYKNLDAYKEFQKGKLSEVFQLNVVIFTSELSDERIEYYSKEIDKQDSFEGVGQVVRQANREAIYYNGLGGPQVDASVKEALKIHPYLKETEEIYNNLQILKKVMPNTAKRHEKIIAEAEKDAKEALTAAKRFIIIKTQGTLMQEWDYFNDYEVYDKIDEKYLNVGYYW